MPTLTGRVAGTDGRAVPRARVTVVDPHGAQVDVATGSEDGRFAVQGRTGEWVTVLVSAPGRDAVSARLRLRGPVSHHSFLLGDPTGRAGPVPAAGRG